MNQGVTRKCNPYFFGRGAENAMPIDNAQSNGEPVRIFLRRQ